MRKTAFARFVSFGRRRLRSVIRAENRLKRASVFRADFVYLTSQIENHDPNLASCRGGASVFRPVWPGGAAVRAHRLLQRRIALRHARRSRCCGSGMDAPGRTAVEYGALSYENRAYRPGDRRSGRRSDRCGGGRKRKCCPGSDVCHAVRLQLYPPRFPRPAGYGYRVVLQREPFLSAPGGGCTVVRDRGGSRSSWRGSWTACRSC